MIWEEIVSPSSDPAVAETSGCILRAARRVALVRLLEVRVHVVRVKQRHVKRSPDDIGTAEQRDNDDQVLETRARRARESTTTSHIVGLVRHTAATSLAAVTIITFMPHRGTFSSMVTMTLGQFMRDVRDCISSSS